MIGSMRFDVPKRAKAEARRRVMEAQSIAERLRELREERGLSQSALARRANLTPAAINRIEMGKRSPTSETIGKLAAGLGVQPGELFPPLVLTG